MSNIAELYDCNHRKDNCFIDISENNGVCDQWYTVPGSWYIHRANEDMLACTTEKLHEWENRFGNSLPVNFIGSGWIWAVHPTMHGSIHIGQCICECSIYCGSSCEIVLPKSRTGSKPVGTLKNWFILVQSLSETIFGCPVWFKDRSLTGLGWHWRRDPSKKELSPADVIVDHVNIPKYSKMLKSILSMSCST